MGSPIQLTKTRNLNQTTSLTHMGLDLKSKGGGGTLDSDQLQHSAGEAPDGSPVDSKFK
jgi:hypothetical protein